MKKAILIILSLLIITCLFSVTALAAPAEIMFLRAGGAIGGGGGGGGGHFRAHLFRDAFDGTEGMSVGERLAALGYYVIVYLFYAAFCTKPLKSFCYCILNTHIITPSYNGIG